MEEILPMKFYKIGHWKITFVGEYDSVSKHVHIICPGYNLIEDTHAYCYNNYLNCYSVITIIEFSVQLQSQNRKYSMKSNLI